MSANKCQTWVKMRQSQIDAPNSLGWVSYMSKIKSKKKKQGLKYGLIPIFWPKTQILLHVTWYYPNHTWCCLYNETKRSINNRYCQFRYQKPMTMLITILRFWNHDKRNCQCTIKTYDALILQNNSCTCIGYVSDTILVGFSLHTSLQSNFYAMLQQASWKLRRRSHRIACLDDFLFCKSKRKTQLIGPRRGRRGPPTRV